VRISILRGRVLPGLLTALLVVAPVACRKPAQPSEAYAQAHTRFGKLYAAKGDEVFVDPELAEVDALLAQVPANSLDAAAANELRGRLQAGRQQAEARRKAQDEALAQARAPGEMPAGMRNSPSAPSTPEPSSPEPSSEPEDAGTAGVPGIGTPEAVLASGFSGCFQKGEPLEVRGRGLRDRWELQDRPACRQQYGSLQDQILITENGKVFGLAPKSSIQALPADGGLPPDGGR
jgi:hypothetical protein